MNLYKDLPRLRAEEKTGRKHILVKQHQYESYPRHWHDYFEIEVVVRGQAVHAVNGMVHDVGAGDACLLTPVDFHHIEEGTPVEIINVSFDDRWLSDETRSLLYLGEGAELRHLEPEETERFIAAATLLRHEYETDGPCVRQLLEYLLSGFLPDECGGAGKGQVQSDGILRAVAYIEQHFREKITLELLAARSGYHPVYFSNLFCKVMGQSYSEYLTALRIRYAKRLLRGGLSVSEACFAAGFGSLSGFAATFRRQSGCSPSAYRNAHKDSGAERQRNGKNFAEE